MQFGVGFAALRPTGHLLSWYPGEKLHPQGPSPRVRGGGALRLRTAVTAGDGGRAAW